MSMALQEQAQASAAPGQGEQPQPHSWGQGCLWKCLMGRQGHSPPQPAGLGAAAALDAVGPSWCSTGMQRGCLTASPAAQGPGRRPVGLWGSTLMDWWELSLDTPFPLTQQSPAVPAPTAKHRPYTVSPSKGPSKGAQGTHSRGGPVTPTWAWPQQHTPLLQGNQVQLLTAAIKHKH